MNYFPIVLSILISISRSKIHEPGKYHPIDYEEAQEEVLEIGYGAIQRGVLIEDDVEYLLSMTKIPLKPSFSSSGNIVSNVIKVVKIKLLTKKDNPLYCAMEMS